MFFFFSAANQYIRMISEGSHDTVAGSNSLHMESKYFCVIFVTPGVRMASLGLFLQCVTSVIFSLLMERMVLCIGVRKLYLSSVILLGVSTAVMTVSHNIILVTIMAAATGYTFCTLQILPYTLTCLYHSNAKVTTPNKTSCICISSTLMFIS